MALSFVGLDGQTCTIDTRQPDAVTLSPSGWPVVKPTPPLRITLIEDPIDIGVTYNEDKLSAKISALANIDGLKELQR
jgi:hypothetical protein